MVGLIEFGINFVSCLLKELQIIKVAFTPDP